MRIRKPLKTAAAVAWAIAAWTGCSDSPRLELPAGGNDPLSVGFDVQEAEPFDYGESRAVGVTVAGASAVEAAAPEGWTAVMRENEVLIGAPAAPQDGCELAGDVTVTARNEAGASRSASLRVFIGEWEPHVEFADPTPQEFEWGESRTLQVTARHAASVEVSAPRGWTAQWNGQAVVASAPTAETADCEKRGTITLTAFSESGAYRCTASVEAAVTDAPSVNLNEGGARANCYIVSQPGTTYYFDPTVMGNGPKGLSDGLRQKLAEHGNQVTSTLLPEPAGAILVWESEQGLLAGVKLSADRQRLSFKTRAGAFAPGNALVAAVDAQQRIIWSWHIWITDRPAEQLYSNGDVMMDRDLGATSSEPASFEAIGLMYQWGRKDPFPAGCDRVAGNNRDGEVFVSDNSRKMATHEAHPFRVSYTGAGVGTIEYAVQHPTEYIATVALTGGGDWYYGTAGWDESDRNPYLWGNPQGGLLADDGRCRKGEKTVYDPCPPGWRVPDADTYALFCKRGGAGGVYADGVFNIHGTPDDYRVPTDYRGTPGNHWIVGLNFIYDQAGNYSWFPAEGSRVSETGSLAGAGMNIFRWTNSPYKNSPRHSYYLWASKEYLYPMRDGGDRAYGYSVRCMKEL